MTPIALATLLPCGASVIAVAKESPSATGAFMGADIAVAET